MAVLNKSFFTLSLMVLVVACSSGGSREDPLSEVDGESQAGFSNLGTEAEQEMGVVPAVSAGAPTLNFFASLPTYGIVLSAFRWDQALSSTNPGMDCRLQLRKMGPPTNVFACLVKAKDERPLIVTAIENFQGSTRQLARVILDTQGNASMKRWSDELRAAGYKTVSASRPTFVSADGRTRAEFIWVAEKSALSIVFRPAR